MSHTFRPPVDGFAVERSTTLSTEVLSSVCKSRRLSRASQRTRVLDKLVQARVTCAVGREFRINESTTHAK